jgi:hypothetical protein
MNSIRSARKQASRLLEIDQTLPLSVRVPVGSAVHCITGQAWLTQEGLADDVILAAGEKFVVRQKGLIVMNAIRGAALVYLSPNTREHANDAVIFTHDFLDAAQRRAAELRREEMARLAGIAWCFMMRLVKRTKELWKNERSTVCGLLERNLGRKCVMAQGTATEER